MTKKQAAILNVAVSLLFAVTIILVAKFSPDESGFTVTGILIAIWFVPFWTLSNWGEGSIQKELACFKNWLQRN
jgi:hypothetical protein